jgi:prepilin-type N-terminal cleavage/methylation domain-containing protein
MRKLCRAFTLVEILVVLAIIAVIAALVFPAFVSAKKEAKKLTCLQKLKQIGTSLVLYRNDHDDLIPTDDIEPTHEYGLPLRF